MNFIKKIAAPITNAVILFLVLALSLTGCSSNKKASTNYIAGLSDDALPPIRTYIVHATSRDDIKALNEAASKAHRFCKATDERAEVLDYRTQYQGMTDGEKNLTRKANNVLDQSRAIVSNHDYKITMRFRCLSKQQEISLIRIANQMAGTEVEKVK